MKSQGRRGEVAADLHTDFPELFEKRKDLFVLAPDGSRRQVRLQEFWGHKGRIVLKFADVECISDAERLVGHEVQVRREERAGLEPGAVYISDLQGCRVIATGPSGEREIGSIVDVTFGAGEAPLLVIKGRHGMQEKEYLVPFATEYVVNADLDAKRIVMSLPEGMLELDAPLSSEEKRSTQDS